MAYHYYEFTYQNNQSENLFQIHTYHSCQSVSIIEPTSLTSVINAIIMIKEFAKNSFHIFLVFKGEKLVSVPHEIHIIAWHNEHILT